MYFSYNIVDSSNSREFSDEANFSRQQLGSSSSASSSDPTALHTVASDAQDNAQTPVPLDTEPNMHPPLGPKQQQEPQTSALAGAEHTFSNEPLPIAPTNPLGALAGAEHTFSNEPLPIAPTNPPSLCALALEPILLRCQQAVRCKLIVLSEPHPLTSAHEHQILLASILPQCIQPGEVANTLWSQPLHSASASASARLPPFTTPRAEMAIIVLAHALGIVYKAPQPRATSDAAASKRLALEGLAYLQRSSPASPDKQNSILNTAVPRSEPFLLHEYLKDLQIKTQELCDKAITDLQELDKQFKNMNLVKASSVSRAASSHPLELDEIQAILNEIHAGKSKWRAEQHALVLWHLCQIVIQAQLCDNPSARGARPQPLSALSARTRCALTTGYLTLNAMEQAVRSERQKAIQFGSRNPNLDKDEFVQTHENNHFDADELVANPLEHLNTADDPIDVTETAQQSVPEDELRAMAVPDIDVQQCLPVDSGPYTLPVFARVLIDILKGPSVDLHNILSITGSTSEFSVRDPTLLAIAVSQLEGQFLLSNDVNVKLDSLLSNHHISLKSNYRGVRSFVAACPEWEECQRDTEHRVITELTLGKVRLLYPVICQRPELADCESNREVIAALPELVHTQENLLDLIIFLLDHNRYRSIVAWTNRSARQFIVTDMGRLALAWSFITNRSTRHMVAIIRETRNLLNSLEQADFVLKPPPLRSNSNIRQMRNKYFQAYKLDRQNTIGHYWVAFKQLLDILCAGSQGDIERAVFNVASAARDKTERMDDFDEPSDI